MRLIRIPFFASWARIRKPFTKAKHYTNAKAICIGIKKGEKYANHIEMAGRQSASIISYGCKKTGALRIMRHAIFPTLRFAPNKTHDSVDYNFKGFCLYQDGKMIKEKAQKIVFDGVLNIISTSGDLTITRSIFAAATVKALCEIVEIRNNLKKEIRIDLRLCDSKILTAARRGANGRRYNMFSVCDKKAAVLKAGAKCVFNVSYLGTDENEAISCDNKIQLLKRREMIMTLDNTLVIETPDDKINLMARYAKIRASESIFDTKGGPMHSPGGGGYYAAVWTNDQCEYVNPLFAYLGYDLGVAQSINCYALYKKYITKDKPVISSIIAEGESFWNGVRDRGDCAMYAYGAARFLLAKGDKALAKSFIGAIEDCLSYTISQINADGVVASDSDELENRFLSGRANLSTSCIAYDALTSASMLQKELGNAEMAEMYFNQAVALGEGIEKYFGRTVEGFDTYRYCAEETKLRSWIALPLAVGLWGRAEATKNALLSDKLRVGEGLVTRSGEKTFWDRSTLYALRGLFYAGFSDDGFKLLLQYTEARLLGEHIPYAVEAFPEGNQAQLSAESGLYIRVLTEGILGFRPTGFGKFSIRPSIPKRWAFFNIKNISLAGHSVDICISGGQITVTVDKNKKINAKSGQEVSIF